MKSIVFNWKQSIREESNRAIEMSQWCRQLGLKLDIDYTWKLDKDNSQIVFTFSEQKESMASMLAMRWL